MSQAGQEATFHIDHIVPRADGGRATSANLALACAFCSLRKEARRSVPDPHTGRNVPLFHPRRQRWRDHFRWDGPVLIAKTSTGRATLAALQMNRALILAIRREEMKRHRHPPE